MVAARDLPSVDVMAANIVDTFWLATDAEQIAGVEWYLRARALASELADEYGLSIELTAGVIAVVSPGTEWSENARLARDACRVWQDTRDVQAVKDLAAHASSRSAGHGLRRAGRLLSTGTTADVERQERTRKVHAFWRSILGAEDLPCVDVHATRVALGDCLGSETHPSTDAAYLLIAQAYRKAGAELGMPARDVQAVTWLVCIRLRDADRRAHAGEVL